jgi:hypothetical protein
VLTAESERLQVKARVVADPTVRGGRQLSVFRSWDFDAAVVVLFDDAFRVWRAAWLPVETVRAAARFSEHVRGYRVIATDALLERGDNWTDRLRQVVD